MTLIVRPGSLLIAAATLPMSMSGWRDKAMICKAIAGGLGKFPASSSLRFSVSIIARLVSLVTYASRLSGRHAEILRELINGS